MPCQKGCPKIWFSQTPAFTGWQVPQLMRRLVDPSRLPEDRAWLNFWNAWTVVFLWWMKWLYLKDVFVKPLFGVYVGITYMMCFEMVYSCCIQPKPEMKYIYSMKIMYHMCVLDSCTINVYVYIDDDWHSICTDWVWLQGTILSHIRLELSRPLMKAIADALKYLFLRCFDRWCETMQMTWCFYWTKVQEHAPFHQMHIYIGTDLVHEHTQVLYRFERYGTYFFKITDIIYTIYLNMHCTHIALLNSTCYMAIYIVYYFDVYMHML